MPHPSPRVQLHRRNGKPALSDAAYHRHKAELLCLLQQHPEECPILGEQLGDHFGVDKRVIRDWVHRLREERNAVGSSGDGYWWAVTPEQKQRVARQLYSRVGQIGQAAAAMQQQAKEEAAAMQQPRLIAEAPSSPPTPPAVLPLAAEPIQLHDRVLHPELGRGRVINYQANSWGDRVQVRFDRGCYGWFYLHKIQKLNEETT